MGASRPSPSLGRSPQGLRDPAVLRHDGGLTRGDPLSGSPRSAPQTPGPEGAPCSAPQTPGPEGAPPSPPAPPRPPPAASPLSPNPPLPRLGGASLLRAMVAIGGAGCSAGPASSSPDRVIEIALPTIAPSLDKACDDGDPGACRKLCESGAARGCAILGDLLR